MSRLSCARSGRIGRLCLVGILSAPWPVAAQGTGITAVNVRQYLSGSQTPVAAPFTIPVTAVTCNQPAPPAAPPPYTTFYWDDPQAAGMVCVYHDPGTGPLFAKVYGALELTLTNLAGALESPESNRAPFSHPPSAPTSLRVGK